MKRYKTKYPGVFNRDADRIGGAGIEQIFPPLEGFCLRFVDHLSGHLRSAYRGVELQYISTSSAHKTVNGLN